MRAEEEANGEWTGGGLWEGDEAEAWAQSNEGKGWGREKGRVMKGLRGMRKINE